MLPSGARQLVQALEARRFFNPSLDSGYGCSAPGTSAMLYAKVSCRRKGVFGDARKWVLGGKS